jgi:protein-S-isoprenylcysteine O-methyltransferase Ste14
VLVLAGALAASAAAAAVDPVARPSPALRALGGALAASGVAVAGAGVAAFRRRRTTVDPRYPERATALVDEGVYRWTRNPMYVGFVGVAAGAAALLGSPLALLGPGLLAAYLDRVQIPAEERALRARFGAPFESYARTVRRWVGRGPPPRPGRTDHPDAG